MNVPKNEIPIYTLLSYYTPKKARMFGLLHGILHKTPTVKRMAVKGMDIKDLVDIVILRYNH